MRFGATTMRPHHDVHAAGGCRFNGLITQMARVSLPIDESQYQRFCRLLPPLVNLELLVLKGHLLVEAELQYFLEAVSRHPNSLEDARLSFIQKVHLVQALGGWPRSD